MPGGPRFAQVAGLDLPFRKLPQGGYRQTIAVAFDRNRHPSSPIRPALVNVSRHFDLVGCWVDPG